MFFFYKGALPGPSLYFCICNWRLCAMEVSKRVSSLFGNLPASLVTLCSLLLYRWPRHSQGCALDLRHISSFSKIENDYWMLEQLHSLPFGSLVREGTISQIWRSWPPRGKWSTTRSRERERTPYSHSLRARRSATASTPWSTTTWTRSRPAFSIASRTGYQVMIGSAGAYFHIYLGHLKYLRSLA